EHFFHQAWPRRSSRYMIRAAMNLLFCPAAGAKTSVRSHPCNIKINCAVNVEQSSFCSKRHRPGKQIARNLLTLPKNRGTLIKIEWLSHFHSIFLAFSLQILYTDNQFDNQIGPEPKKMAACR